MVKNLVAVVLSALFCFGALEVGLRLYDQANGRSFFSSRTILPYRIFGHKVYDKAGGELRIRSRHGEIFPFDKPPGTVRIVTFGGSTSVNAAVYDEHGVHYSALLQERLNNRFPGKMFEVISVANQGYATPHSLTLLALDVLSWDPDIVIVSHNTNDLHASYFPDFVPDYSNKYAHPYYNQSWLRHTCLNVRICRTVQSRIEKNGLITYPIKRRSYGLEPADQVQRVFERNLESFAQLATSRGICVVMASQPMRILTEAEFDREMGIKSYNAEVVYPLHEEFVSHHARFNEIIASTATRLDVSYADNAEDFAGNPEYFLDQVHYSKPGVERLASNYEDVIASMIGTDPGSADCASTLAD